jgi:hypothetical protein
MGGERGTRTSSLSRRAPLPSPSAAAPCQSPARPACPSRYEGVNLRTPQQAAYVSISHPCAPLLCVCVPAPCRSCGARAGENRICLLAEAEQPRSEVDISFSAISRTLPLPCQRNKASSSFLCFDLFSRFVFTFPHAWTNKCKNAGKQLLTMSNFDAACQRW